MTLRIDPHMEKYIEITSMKPTIAGYPRVKCKCAFTGKNCWKLVHHIVWEYAYGPRKKGYHIHHIDGDRYNNLLSNLEDLPASVHMHISNVGTKKPTSGAPGVQKTFLHSKKIGNALRNKSKSPAHIQAIKNSWALRKKVV